MTSYKSHNKGPLECHYKVPRKVQPIHFAEVERKKSTPFWGRVTHWNNHSSSSHNLDTAECPSILFGPKSSEIPAHEIFGNFV